MSLSAIAGALLVAALQNEIPLVSDPAWKQWLEEVKPLMLRAERDAARKLPASARETFREQFWAARDQDPATTFNETRSAFNHRVESADRRYRQSDGGPWNDCGKAFVLFGPPDVRNEVRIMAQAMAPDRLAAYRDEQDQVAETWTYRNHPLLPASPQGYQFRFTPSCEAFEGASFGRVMQLAAEAVARRVH